MNKESVKPGQTWVSNDRRDAGIEFVIIKIDGDYAICGKTNGRVTRIRIDRFKLTATGYKLVKDVAGDNQEAKP
jgi:hypothetical protein